MKLFCITKPVVVVSIALILSLVLASSSEARSSLGRKLSTGIVTLGVLALPFTPALTGKVLAQNSEVNTPAQVVQAQSQADARIPLYEAVKIEGYEWNNYKEVAALLEAGKIDINARDAEGNTGLHILVKESIVDLETLQLLLAHGLDAKIKDNKGRTAQSYVRDMHGGEPEAAIELSAWTEAIYGINGKDQDGYTALSYALDWASYLNDIELARYLVAVGADVHLVDYTYHDDLGISDALDAAAVLVAERDAFIKVAKEKAKGGLISVARQRGEGLLKLAVRWGNIVVAEALIDHGVNPSVGLFNASYVHGDGGTVIVSDNDPDNNVLSFLLKRGADVNFKHENGHTAINLATEGGKPRTVEILLTHGADPNVPDKWKMTPLHRASKRSEGYAFEMVSMLLARGAKANVKDIDGKTPYDNLPPYSVRPAREAATAALLLYAMVGTEGKDIEGRTPEYWAKKSGSETIQKIVAGEIEIIQLFDRKIRQHVLKELREPVLK